MRVAGKNVECHARCELERVPSRGRGHRSSSHLVHGWDNAGTLLVARNHTRSFYSDSEWMLRLRYCTAKYNIDLYRPRFGCVPPSFGALDTTRRRFPRRAWPEGCYHELFTPVTSGRLVSCGSYSQGELSLRALCKKSTPIKSRLSTLR